MNIIHFYTSSVLKDDCFQFLLLQVVLHKPPLCASFCGGYQEERLLPNHSRERRTKLEVSLRLQTIRQNCSNQNNMAMAQKQTHRSTGQNTAPRNKATRTWSRNLRQRRQEYTVGKDSLFNKWSRKLDSYLQNNQNCRSTFSHHIQK